MGCDQYEAFMCLSAILGGLWLAFSLWWTWNSWYPNRMNTKPVHKIMSFVLLFKTLFEIDCAFLFAFCDNTASSYLGLARATTFTLSNTFVFTSLVLLSKGFCVTRF